MKKQTKRPQINKNNKTKPENLMKKEYAETLEKIKKRHSRRTTMNVDDNFW